jgi:hypothetical protein
MTPQLKYALIALFIVLDVCIVVYFFTDTFIPPAKQPVPSPPVVQQPPSQSTTPSPAPRSQPPVSPVPVQPPPQPTPEQIAKEECNRSAQWYRNEFTKTWPERLRESRDRIPYDDIDSARVQKDFRGFRAQWYALKSTCHTRALGQWYAPFEADIEDLPLKLDCDVRGRNYGEWFMRLFPMSATQRNDDLRAYNVNGGETYEQFVTHFGQLETRCSNDITGGWKAPFDKSKIVRTSR